MNREEIIINRIDKFLQTSHSIIDIGCGKGLITKLLRDRNKKVTAIDVNSFKYPRKIPDVVFYDGKKIPFLDNSFDTALLITVLHHTPNPNVVFSEAKRVAKNIIVMETVCNNFFEKLSTVLIDSAVNLQIKFYWQSYKSEKEWEEFFLSQGLKINTKQKYSDRNLFIPFSHVVYFLTKI